MQAATSSHSRLTRAGLWTFLGSKEAELCAAMSAGSSLRRVQRHRSRRLLVRWSECLLHRRKSWPMPFRSVARESRQVLLLCVRPQILLLIVSPFHSMASQGEDEDAEWEEPQKSEAAVAGMPKLPTPLRQVLAFPAFCMPLTISADSLVSTPHASVAGHLVSHERVEPERRRGEPFHCAAALLHEPEFCGVTHPGWRRGAGCC